MNMKEFRLKTQKRGKIILLIAVVIYAICVVCGQLKLAPESIQNYVVVPAGFGSIILFVCYFAIYLPSDIMLYKLSKINQLDVADDIVLNKKYTLPKAKIYCGEKALVRKYPLLVIPYEEVAWVYKRVTKTSYGLTTDEKILFCLRNGMKKRCEMKDNEVNYLVNNYIAPVVPNLIVGFDKARKNAYKQIVKEHKSK